MADVTTYGGVIGTLLTKTEDAGTKLVERGHAEAAVST
jgi:hypothetical protein